MVDVVISQLSDPGSSEGRETISMSSDSEIRVQPGKIATFQGDSAPEAMVKAGPDLAVVFPNGQITMAVNFFDPVAAGSQPPAVNAGGVTYLPAHFDTTPEIAIPPVATVTAPTVDLPGAEIAPEIFELPEQIGLEEEEIEEEEEAAADDDLKGPPDAVDDFGETDKNTAIMIDLLGNDSDPDGDPIEIVSFNLEDLTVVIDSEGEPPEDVTGPIVDAIGELIVNNVKEDGTGINFDPNDPTVDEHFEQLCEGDTEIITFTYTITDIDGNTDTATVTITVVGENDPVTINVSDAEPVLEPLDGETDQAVFTVSLTNPVCQTVMVTFATEDGSAMQPEDYIFTTGVLIFEPGETEKQVFVDIVGDDISELTEMFNLVLSEPVGGDIGDGVGVGTILDQPKVSVNDVTVTEPEVGTVAATFTFSLDLPAEQDITITYRTLNGGGAEQPPGNDAAFAPGDYVEITTDTVVIPAGSTSVTVDVTVNADDLDEFDENFRVEIIEAEGAYIDDGTGLGTIIDSDEPPTITIDDVVILEPDSGDTAVATLTISLSGASAKPITLDFATADGTTPPFAAISGEDYDPDTGMLTINPGDTSATVEVTILGDDIDEFDELMRVILSNAENAVIADDTGTVTILDNDPEPNLTIDDVTVIEPEVGTKFATFTITLDAVSGKDVTVQYRTLNGGGAEQPPGNDAANAPGDYTEIGFGEVVIPAGSTSVTVQVEINADDFVEADENYRVEITNAENANVADDIGLGTIIDVDKPKISIDDVTVTEPVSGTVEATFTISLDQASPNEIVRVNWATINGGGAEQPPGNDSAIAEGDYLSNFGFVEFAPGETTQTVTILVNADDIAELDENFRVILSDPENATIADETGLGTIIDQDIACFFIDDVTVQEPTNPDEFVEAVFRVFLSPVSSQAVSVDFFTQPGTAEEFLDYIPVSGTLDFAPEQVEAFVTVLVRGDLVDEIDEIFTVQLTNNTPGTIIADPEGVGTILDDPFENNPPDAVDDEISIHECEYVTINTVSEGLLGNDSDPDGDPITVVNTGTFITALGATITVNADGTYTYDPSTSDFIRSLDDGEYATDSFDYTIADPEGLQDSATLTINIEGTTNVPIVGTNGDDILDGDCCPDVIIGDPGGNVLITVPTTFNVLYILDVSGSMGRGDPDRIEILQEAIKNLNEAYNDLINNNPLADIEINMQVIAFSDDADIVTPGDQAIMLDGGAVNLSILDGVIDGLNASGYTSYTDALTAATDYMSGVQLTDPSREVINTTYFVSDGEPCSPGPNCGAEPGLFLDGINDGDWSALLDDPNIDVRALGIGPDITSDPNAVSNLNLIDNSAEGAILVPDLDPDNIDDLTDALMEIAFSRIENAEPGNDDIWGGKGNDIIYGDFAAGENLQGVGNLTGYAALIAALGSPEAVYDFIMDPTNDFANAFSLVDPQNGGNDIIYGDLGNDLIFGEGGADEIYGGIGDDRIFGGSGADWIGGQAGNDILVGENGRDDISGGEGNDELYGGRGADVLSGDAGNDIIYGGRGNDTISYDSEDTVLVDAGEGLADILVFEGANEVLDLTHLPTDVINPGQKGVFSNFEKVDLTGTGDNTVILDANAVVDMTDDNNSLYIFGDNGDTVEAVDAGWTPVGIVSVGPDTFTHYVNGGANMFVEETVNTIFI